MHWPMVRIAHRMRGGRRWAGTCDTVLSSSFATAAVPPVEKPPLPPPWPATGHGSTTHHHHHMPVWTETALTEASAMVRQQQLQQRPLSSVASVDAPRLSTETDPEGVLAELGMKPEDVWDCK